MANTRKKQNIKIPIQNVNSAGCRKQKIQELDKETEADIVNKVI